MKIKNLRNKSNLLALLVTLITAAVIMVGCGDSNVAGIQDKESGISSSGESSFKEESSFQKEKIDSTKILLDMNLRFKKVYLNDTRYLESNLGNEFRNIVSVEADIKPNQELDLQELQPFGIFALYLISSDNFTLSNSDGLSISIKTVLFEKCSFIDLKLKNNSGKPIHISGLIAGE